MTNAYEGIQMRTMLLLLLLFSYSVADSSFDNFVDNNLQLYPAGCSMNFADMSAGLHPGGVAEVASATVPFDLLDSLGETVVGQIRVFRVGCAEANRSLVLVEFTFPNNNNGRGEGALLPSLAFTGRVFTAMRYTLDPNVYVAGNSAGGAETQVLSEGQSMVFYLDQETVFGERFESDNVLVPADINGAFILSVLSAFGPPVDIPVPAYGGGLRPQFMPINGRLSGVWVSQGAEDQGFVISFSELEGNFEQGLVFFSWYTFDADGNNVWLVGNNLFDHGDGSTTFPVQFVTNGEFLGTTRADRVDAGSVQLIARSCERIEMNFDLRPIGLGQGTIALKRSFKLETMGYACMDVQTKFNTPN